MSNQGNLPLAGTPEQQLADPLHLFPNADNAGQPSNLPPSVLPNLGAASMMPIAPHGAFNPGIHSQGAGPYNLMAAQGAGNLFNPTAMPSKPAVSPQMSQKGGQFPTQLPQAYLGMNGLRGNPK